MGKFSRILLYAMEHRRVASMTEFHSMKIVRDGCRARPFRFFARRLALAALAATGPAFGAQPEVWTQAEWLAAWPEQRDLAEAFERRVAAPEGARADFGDRPPVRIAAIYPTIQDSDYWIRNLAAFEARLDEIGLPYALKLYRSRPQEADVRTQQLREALARDPDYVIATMDTLKDAATVERLLSRKRPKLLVQNSTTPLRSFGGRQPLMYAGFDHETGSRALAGHFKAAYPDGADWVLLLFAEGYVSDQRGGGFLKALEGGKGMRLREIYLTAGDKRRTHVAVRDALARHEQIDFFFACSTDIGLEAVAALREAGKSDATVVNGWGGGEAELAAVAAGELVATAMRMNDDAGVAMAEAISMDLQGLGQSVPTVYSGEFRLVTKDTSPEDVGEFQRRAFRYSGMEGFP